MITLKLREWNKISKLIKAEHAHKPSILMIREVTKRELGFTTRHHKQWNPGMSHYDEIMFLDFYNDAAETFFRLKYLNNDSMA